ncbi:MAG: hypothetical protein F4Y63_05480 [Chloroflexi bacterium]|nr:hypothetical protein [Chloroflexota bacterium]MYK62442.1 hypothetical protein [Chloroflexota bacterium]
MNSYKSDTSDTASENLHRAAETIAESKYVVVMTGAGMSVESGIPPFRGTNGLWTKYGTPSMDGYRQFRADPAAYWDRQINAQIDEHIIELRESLRRAKPHDGHFALVGLVNRGYVKSVITQNIDGLDLKAGMGDALIEIHGNRSRLRCIGCAKRTDLNDFVPLFVPDPCDECGEPVKFDAVMFGEPIVPEVMSAAREQIDRADCVVAIGTSATVRPASGLLWVAKHRSRGDQSNGPTRLPDAKLIEINPNPTKLSSICDVVVRMNAKSGVPALLEALVQTRVVFLAVS